MPRSAPPVLPPFLRAAFPFDRGVHRLEAGPARGRLLHYVDHGPRDAPIALLQHGNPTWSYLWRKVIPGLEGLRILAPDLLGLGLSDTLELREHSVDTHVDVH